MTSVLTTILHKITLKMKEALSSSRMERWKEERNVFFVFFNLDIARILND